MRTALVLFTRDLRVHDNPALADMRASLPDRGGDLVRRTDDPVAETMRPAGEVGATMLGTDADVSAYARRREARLTERFDPDGVYVRRYVPELISVEGAAVHQPWRLPAGIRRGRDHPAPLESHRGEVVWLRP